MTSPSRSGRPRTWLASRSTRCQDRARRDRLPALFTVAALAEVFELDLNELNDLGSTPRHLAS